MDYTVGCVDEYDFDYVPKMIKGMENHPLHANRQKEKPMNNIDKAKQAVEAAQKQLEDAIKALEQVEKKSTNIGLKLPEMGESYYSKYYGGGPGIRADCNTYAYLASFDSTNKAQQQAFQEALVVMAEMRTQDGIVVPGNSHSLYTISYDSKWCCLRTYNWACSVGMSLFPAFESEDAAQTAINAVGEERIINCIKTMMFLTPESRGEA